jgi:ketosteroid isomerase-like protein
VLTRYRGRGKGSGVPVDNEGAHVWALRDGKVVRLEIFADRADALAAAGLAD